MARHGNSVYFNVERRDMESKSIWQSKTFWVNLISIGAIIGAAYGFEIDTETQAILATGILAIMNIILRFITKQPIR